MPLKPPLEIQCEAAVGDVYKKSDSVVVSLGRTGLSDGEGDDAEADWREWAQYFSLGTKCCSSNLVIICICGTLGISILG